MIRWSAALGALLLVSCAAGPAVDPGWTWVDLEAFALAMPEDLKQVPVKNIDSFVGRFESPKMTLGFDWGQWSNPLTKSDGPELTREAVQVHGRKAVLVVSRSAPDSPHPFEAAIHFPNPGNRPNPESDDAKLTIYMELNEESCIPTARKIFDSIRFRKD
jgi:hypothetical protein